VFIVVLKECHGIVLEDDCGTEEGEPEVDHALEVGAAEDDVGEGDGLITLPLLNSVRLVSGLGAGIMANVR
jgi:hypothetical protein